MEIILFRHGDAYDIGENGIDTDEERMLRPKGKRHTKDMCQLLSQIGCRPDCIYSSPLVRAVETAVIASKFLKVSQKIRIADFLSPSFQPVDVFKNLKDIKDSSVLLVGHMPSLSLIGSSLISGKGSNDSLNIKKSGACSISFESTMQEGTGQLNWLLQRKIIDQTI